jgi:beta-lactamase regulating signal transducer with metallopeptidase domain
MDFLAHAALSNAIVVSVLAPIILAVDRLSKCPPLTHRLWLILLIKLVTPPLVPIALPWPVTSRLPAPTAAPANPADPSGSRSDPTHDRRVHARVARPSSADLHRNDSSPPSRVSSFAQVLARYVTLRWGPALATVWLAVSGSWLAWTLVQLVQISRRLGAVPIALPEVQELAQSIARKFDLNGAPRVCFVPWIPSPALWALGRRPRLVVPEELWTRLDQDQRAALLAHELAHLRRRDHWIRPLEMLVTSLFWWFPVAWWIRKSLRQAEEQCCDAWVIRLLPGCRGAYARTLLETIDFLAESRQLLPAAVSGFSNVVSLRTRLSQIMKGGFPPSLSRTGAIWVAAVFLIAIPFTWREQLDRGVPWEYRVIDLGQFDPVAINNAGQIVGTPMGLLRQRAHRWEHGRWTDLAESESLFVTPTDMNDRGQVTGWYEVLLEPASTSITPNGILERAAKYSSPHAFRTVANRPIDLPADDIGTLGGEESRGLAINNAGQVAGKSTLARTSLPGYQLDRAFRTAPDQPINPATDQLDRLDVEGIHYGILNVAMNNLGDAVITTDASGVRRPAFLATPGRMAELISPDPGPGDETGTEFTIGGVNDRRQAVARVYSWGRYPVDVAVSFHLDPGRRMNLETDRLFSRFVPKAINDNGLVLGSVDPLFLQPYSKEAIHDGRRLHRLSDLLPAGSGWMIWYTAGMNDRNQIIGVAVTPHKETHGILLDPAPSSTWLFWLLAGTALTGVGHAATTARLKTRK